MKFLDIYKQLQEKNIDTIVLVRNGIFFVALEKSALALQALFTLRPICFREGVCKCVIPVQQIKKYMDRMIYLKHNFILYEYEKMNMDNKIEMLYEYKQGNKLSQMQIEQNCDKCWYKSKKITNFDKDFKKIIEEYKYGE